MPPPQLDPISSSDVNISWEIPDMVTEVRGLVVMYQVVMVTSNRDVNPYAPEKEDKVRTLLHNYILLLILRLLNHVYF